MSGSADAAAALQASSTPRKEATGSPPTSSKRSPSSSPPPPPPPASRSEKHVEQGQSGAGRHKQSVSPPQTASQPQPRSKPQPQQRDYRRCRRSPVAAAQKGPAAAPPPRGLARPLPPPPDSVPGHQRAHAPHVPSTVATAATPPAAQRAQSNPPTAVPVLRRRWPRRWHLIPAQSGRTETINVWLMSRLQMWRRRPRRRQQRTVDRQTEELLQVLPVLTVGVRGPNRGHRPLVVEEDPTERLNPE